jgi:bloom syndrome protein
MSPKDRHGVQSLWAKNTIQIIVATIAFGMGIDKPDVRYVIHYTLPKSLEGYYQETGRAGRDGLNSTCIMFYSYSDKSTVDYLIGRSESGHQQKQRQRESLRDVIQYCENRIDCRRTLILHYFGESFDRRDCHKSCDNCESAKEIVTRDFTEAAQDLLSLLKSIRGKITLIQLVDIFRGSASKKSVQYEHLRQYGSGKSLSRGDAERLSQMMVTQRILEEYCETNGLGFVSSYVRMGSEAHSLEDGRRRVSLINHVGEEKGGRQSGSKECREVSKKKAFSKVTQSKDIRQALEVFRNADDEGERYLDDYDEFHHPADEHYDMTMDESESVDPGKDQREMQCFDELLRLREKICMKTNLSSKFLSNAIIGELSKMPPKDAASLAAITDGGPLIEKHQVAILAVTRKYH